jgi:asparagine synthase (glutamine-hydrolysing)
MEFAASLHEKLGAADGDQSARRILKDLVPAENLSRGKMRFGVPIGHWFRGTMQPFCAQTLFRKAAQPQSSKVKGETARRSTRRSRIDHSHRLWSLLMLIVVSKFID